MNETEENKIVTETASGEAPVPPAETTEPVVEESVAEVPSEESSAVPTEATKGEGVVSPAEPPEPVAEEEPLAESPVSPVENTEEASASPAETKEPIIEQETEAKGEEAEEESMADLKGDWYILHVYTGYENKVKIQIEQLIKDHKLQDKIYKVLIPEEDTIEIKNNRRIEKRKKVYPGYLFMNMIWDDDVWFLLRRINGVSKFVGGSMPEKVVEKDMLRVVRQTGGKVKKIEIDFEVGENVKVISGPFRGYAGSIQEINAEKGKAKVLISIFGRETPMELEFDQLEKNT